MWEPLNQITLTDNWQFTDPIQGELFKITHSNIGSIARAMICQATIVGDKVFLYQVREISANQHEIIKIEKPEAFDNRRIGFCQNYGELNWTIQIEEFIPEPVEDSMIDLGTNKHIRSVSKPASPITGDTWDELASDGSWVCDWFWNGSHWLSRQIFTFTGISMGTTGTDLVSASGSAGMASPQTVPAAYNLFLLNFSAATYVNSPNNSTNYWTVGVSRRSALNVITTIGSFTTQTDAPTTRITKVIPLNLLINLATQDVKLFRVDFTLTGAPGTLQIVSHLNYRWARP
ncbi:MAG: hypothetical protein AB1589_43055 [Cyanobacteriota bacterium]